MILYIGINFYAIHESPLFRIWGNETYYNVLE